MKIIYTSGKLISFKENAHPEIAFIPTMGAIHQGHLNLIKRAKENGQFTVASIFINPLQFNNKEDLKKYPKTIENDLVLLNNVGTDVVFIPDYHSVYPKNSTSEFKIDIQHIESVYEGKFRPGHFDGVVKVLFSLFNLIKPTFVYFGQKDLQQCMVVKKLIDVKFPEIEFNMVETTRENSGLAMSSRNIRLSANGLTAASEIYQSLFNIKQANKRSKSICEREIERLSKFNIQTEYLSIINIPDFDESFEDNNSKAIIYAGYLEGVRLIDNLLL